MSLQIRTDEGRGPKVSNKFLSGQIRGQQFSKSGNITRRVHLRAMENVILIFRSDSVSGMVPNAIRTSSAIRARCAGRAQCGAALPQVSNSAVPREDWKYRSAYCCDGLHRKKLRIGIGSLGWSLASRTLLSGNQFYRLILASCPYECMVRRSFPTRQICANGQAAHDCIC